MTSERLRSLLDAVVAMAGDLTLDGALQSIVDSASELIDAQYGFLGVLDGTSDRRLGTFAVHGLDEAHQGMIGGLPEGRGLLGLVIDHPEPIRFSNLGSHPERAGFPVQHPDMTSFLGVPIRIHDVVFGNLYLTNKTKGGAFTDEDEEIAVALAGAAGVVIENARLYEQGERQRRWLSATIDIATATLKPMSRAAVSQLIAERARDVAQADATAVLTPDAEGRQVVTAVSGVTRTIVGLVADMPFVDEVVRDERPSVSLDPGNDPRLQGGVLEPVSGLRALHAQPLRLEDGTGVLVMGWLEGHESLAASLDPSLPSGFAQQAALAMQVVWARERQSRLAVFEDRDRIGRDLHDLVIQRLFAIGLTLDSLARAVDDASASRLAGAVDGLDLTIKEIRRTIFDLTSPSVPAALREEIEQVASETERLLGFRPTLRIQSGVQESVPPIVAEQILAVLHETTSNVVRHSRATAVEISLAVDDDDVVLEVCDDGTGLDADAPLGNGLRNLRHRAGNLGGRCDFVRPVDGGLCVRWAVPRSEP
ncbi:GAF domain-containing protein [Aeromicrobium sp. CF4.19]|uniref:GAF domain-containing sensor histidine kinase n=1 Tax=Aeromicrobium sp. CF4.19 TaxID=3373082 RepID=UPI003EE4886E